MSSVGGVHMCIIENQAQNSILQSFWKENKVGQFCLFLYKKKYVDMICSLFPLMVQTRTK
jgi:hypothetical protein